MINLLPIEKIITAIAILYAAITCLILWWINSPSTTIWDALGIANGGATAISILIFISIHLGWKKIWKAFPFLNRAIFPNLDGKWKMYIHWQNDDENGISEANVLITQNLLNIAMDVEAEDSDSHTLMAKAKKDPESGKPLLYYVFLTVPNANSSTKDKSPYQGAAILKLSLESEDKLKGNYFTSRQTVGHYELCRVCT